MNDNIIVRQYIPPGFYNRFMHMNRMCYEARAEDQSLKTQLRFGKTNIELFVKFKGDGDPFTKVKLEDYMKVDETPPFDHNVKWKRYQDKYPKKKFEASHNDQQ